MGAALTHLEGLARGVAQAQGLRLYAVRMLERRGREVLEVTVDRAKAAPTDPGVSIDQCAALSRALDLLLDEEEGEDREYTLEVSSPGVERDLERPEHFGWAVGELVRVQKASGAQEPLVLEGRLVSWSEETGEIALRVLPKKNWKKGQVVRLPPMETWELVALRPEEIEKARTVYDERLAPEVFKQG